MKVLSIAGAVFFALVAGLGGLISYAAVKGSALDAESLAYVEATLPRALVNSASENIVSFVAPEDRKLFPPVAVEQFYSYVALNMGAFTSCEPPKGQSTLMIMNGSESITAQYLARCQFSKASVTAKVNLRKRGDKWTLFGVFFDPASIEPSAEGTKPSQKT